MRIRLGRNFLAILFASSAKLQAAGMESDFFLRNEFVVVFEGGEVRHIIAVRVV